MLDYQEITQYFPSTVQSDKRSVLREYLQHHILHLVFQSPISKKLIFIGGTALRIAYNTQRFSEDLDFDNKDLSLDEWIELGDYIQRELRLNGWNIDISKTRLNKTVFHYNIRFPGLLFQYEVSPHKNEVLLIKMDSENQGIEYQSNIFQFNKFDLNSKIKVMPIDIALSQKFRAFFDREMGRDLFDISSIAPKTKPNYDYLKQALNISSPQELKERVLARCQDLDLKHLVERSKGFLFKQSDISRILDFQEYMEQYEF
ncbi:MAG: nucleotidyl transferase AbiEii/AbiGii toxin family protein [Cyanobacteria bacterium]|nr:nucleotidyl transferase AbiEii/AbiGii toxin family protein [Cyanobacteriota bacterium]